MIEDNSRNPEWEKYIACANLMDALEEAMEEEDAAEDRECPSHYNHTIQPWDYMASIMTEEEFIGYLQGNVIKYISRFRDKGGREDVKKAQHYIDKLLSVY